MPSRFTMVVIVAFWLAVGSWWVKRELVPWLDPGEPPPFTIDLADEVRTQGVTGEWTIYRDDVRLGSGRTMILYREATDSFVLDSNFGFTKGLPPGMTHLRLHSRYGIDRSGQLRSVHAHLNGRFQLAGPEEETFEAHLGGQIENEQLQPRGWVAVGDRRIELRSAPVAVPAQRGLLNPLHPVNRVLGLRPGQRWLQPELDPFATVLPSLVPGMLPPAPEWLRAGVLAQPQPLEWDGQTVPCLVIHYQGGEGTVADCWVRQEDGLLLRQEVASGPGGHLVLIRNPETPTGQRPAVFGPNQ